MQFADFINDKYYTFTTSNMAGLIDQLGKWTNWWPSNLTQYKRLGFETVNAVAEAFF